MTTFSGYITNLLQKNCTEYQIADAIVKKRYPADTLKKFLRHLDARNDPALSCLRRVLAGKLVTLWRQESELRGLQRLPSHLFAEVLSYLPEDKKRMVPQSCLGLRELSHEMLAYDSQECSKSLSAFIANEDEQGLNQFIDGLFESLYAKTSLRIKIPHFLESWDRFPEVFAKIYEKFKDVHVEFESPTLTPEYLQSFLTACPAISGFTANHLFDPTNKYTKVIWPNTITRLSLDWIGIESLVNIILQCPELESLTVKIIPEHDGAKVASILSQVRWPPHLKKLELRNSTMLYGTLDSIFASCKALEELFLCDQDRFVLPISIQNSPSALKKLTIISKSIGAEVIGKLLGTCRNIEELRLCDCRDVAASLFIETDWPPSLKVLLLQQGNIDGTGLKKISESSRDLEVLHLKECLDLQASDFRECNWQCSFKELSLPRSNLDDEGLKKFLANSSQLTVLDISGCRKLNAKTLSQFDWPPTLRKLNLAGVLVELETIKKIRQGNKSVELILK